MKTINRASGSKMEDNTTNLELSVPHPKHTTKLKKINKKNVKIKKSPVKITYIINKLRKTASNILSEDEIEYIQENMKRFPKKITSSKKVRYQLKELINSIFLQRVSIIDVAKTAITNTILKKVCYKIDSIIETRNRILQARQAKKN